MLEPEEIEFLGEKTMIDIVPNFTCGIVHFVAGDVGPLKSGLSCKVPLWFAINLKQQAKCTILPPDWLSVDSLTDQLQAEKQSKGFTKMVSDHYMVEAKALLNHAADDIKEFSEVKTLVKDIWDIRMAKIRTSVDALIREGSTVAAMNNLTIMEINTIRPLLPHSLDFLHRIKLKGRSSQSQNNTTLSLNISTRT